MRSNGSLNSDIQTIRNLRNSLSTERGRNEELRIKIEKLKEEVIKAKTARTDAFIKPCDKNNTLKEQYTKIFHENKELIESLAAYDTKPKNLTDCLIGVFMQMQIDDMARDLKIYENQSKEKDQALEVLRRSLEECRENEMRKKALEAVSNPGRSLADEVLITRLQKEMQQAIDRSMNDAMLIDKLHATNHRISEALQKEKQHAIEQDRVNDTLRSSNAELQKENLLTKAENEKLSKRIPVNIHVDVTYKEPVTIHEVMIDLFKSL